MKWNRKEILIAFIHVAVMVLVITLPALGTRLSNADFHEVKEVLYDGIHAAEESCRRVASRNPYMGNDNALFREAQHSFLCQPLRLPDSGILE